MSELSLHIQNVGGIEEIRAEFDDGVTLVAGPNASNKTSLLKALAFALGSDDVPIRSGATRAEVTLSYDGRSITRTAERTDTGTAISGEPWIMADDSDALASFAALLEFNPLRSAIRNGRSFEQSLKEPLDLETLKAERSSKMADKRRLQEELAELEDLDSDLERTREDLSAKRDRIAELEDELQTLREERSESVETDDELEKLREERAELAGERDTQRRQVENTEDAIDRLERRRDEIATRIEDAEARIGDYDVESMQSEKENLERQVAEREDRLDVLQSVLTANREMHNSDFTGVVGRERSLAGDTFTCWACGQPAQAEDFEDTLDELVDLVEQDQSELENYRPRIQEIESRLAEARDVESTLRDLRAQRQDVESTISEREASLETQRERLRDVESRLRDLSEQIEGYEREQADVESDAARRIEDVRVKIQTARNDVERLKDRREELERRLAERDELEEEIDELRSEITALTDQIENTEREIRTSFNETMDDLVSLLEFERVQRIWLDGDFELVIAREADGSVQHESVDHLAESERELIGLVLGLAGYLTYDLQDQAPILALDSLGAFDAARAQRLIEYVGDVADVVLAAVHPDWAAELEFPVAEPSSWTAEA